MADTEERPSKFRKLNSKEKTATESLSPEASAAPSITPSESAADNTPNAEKEEELAEDQEGDPTPNPQNDETPQLSKSARKKLKRKEAWEAGKDDRRLRRREKHKEKQARKAATKAETQALIESGELPASVAEKPKPPPRPILVPVGLILDCDFDELMTEPEMISLGAQMTRCYSENRSARYKTHLCISSWGGRLKERFETVLKWNHLSWRGVKFQEEGFVEAGKLLHEAMKEENGGRIVGPLKGEGWEEDLKKEEDLRRSKKSKSKAPSGNISEKAQASTPGPVSTETKLIESEEQPTQQNGSNSSTAKEEDASEASTLPSTSTTEPQLVYLSSDSPHTLSHLSPHTTYIIGGIVDKNRHKGLCYRRACELGIPTAKLPIGEFMVMNSRTVLAVNHVVEIMLRWLEVGDWGVAFERVVPKRKGGVLRNKGINGESTGSVDGDEGVDHDGDQAIEEQEVDCGVQDKGGDKVMELEDGQAPKS